MPQVTGVEHGVLRHLVNGVAVGADVSVGAKQHAEVAIEGPDLSDRLWPLVFEAEAFIGPLYGGDREEGHQMGLHANRSGARAAAAVRSGEGLVEVEVDDVEAHVARSGDADEGVEIGAI